LRSILAEFGYKSWEHLCKGFKRKSACANRRTSQKAQVNIQG
jgi:hypothetical protein